MKTELKALPRLRVSIAHGTAIGPGKADVLEWIDRTGSLAAAGRELGMSYQHVWTLVKAMNEHFVEALVETKRGGAERGGANLTATGAIVLELYRAAERDATAAINKYLPRLESLLNEKSSK
ncbi:LysR family transcriptional regulator [Duganella sp. FT135W]|uniref:LysR family transcriptional regulator n=1 Tax=Duganella flavida TaxID=2692175 RepID=A0A6L8K4P3_9BURK|nr:LysR family transcriptional regulator [Duganella flavida]MYM22200.1 LysR family transcriptional regulator [Duganella flavida]